MGYVVPSVLVYQQLASSGGVANVTPDLDAVIIGPCFNVLEYDGTSASALTTTAGLTNSGGVSSIVDNTINNVVNLPGQKPGQDVEEGSVEVYLNNASIETLSTVFSVTAGSSELNMYEATGIGDSTVGSAVISSFTGYAGFAVGDPVSISGAGTAGAVLVSVITDIDVAGPDTTVTLADVAGTAVTGTAITKGAISNINTTTATRNVEPGDQVFLKYINGGTPAVFSSTVTEVISLAGIITSIGLSDIAPTSAGGISLITVHKKYNNQALRKTIDGYTNYDDSTVGATGTITIRPIPRLPYGKVVSADVHIAYRALRRDLSGAIIDVGNVNDLEGLLGAPTDRNPLSLGVQLALANTIGRILAVAVHSDDLAGFQAALELTEGRRVYSIVPLTQDIAIITTVQQHVQQMSTPEAAAWRMAVVNSAIPTVQTLGKWNANNVNANGGNNTITLVNGRYILTSSNATFLSDGAVPGDTLVVTSATGIPNQVGSMKILEVLNNQQLQVSATGTATAVSHYVTRTLTKSQQATVVAGICTTLGSNRVMYVPQGAGVTINGVVKYLPGYYLCAAISGLISGLPVQQSLTNVGLAGISDVQFGNFYFTRAQLGTMAAAGACLIVQESQGSIPYSRHSLTTDMTTLYFREIQQVKNWDYLSYFFYDILRGFIGRYNIRPDTLRVLGQSVTAGGRMMQGKKVPKLGAPLLDFSIKTLKQDENNRDTVVVEMSILMPVVMNYLNLYLIV